MSRSVVLTAFRGGSAGGAQLGANGREYEGISGKPFVDYYPLKLNQRLFPGVRLRDGQEVRFRCNALIRKGFRAKANHQGHWV